jgi:hypothetical protein
MSPRYSGGDENHGQPRMGGFNERNDSLRGGAIP